jgi:hypothetical protein
MGEESDMIYWIAALTLCTLVVLYLHRRGHFRKRR